MITALTPLFSRSSAPDLYGLASSTFARALVLSMRSGKRSATATRRAPSILAMRPASKVPRPPQPMSPTVTAELAALPRTALKGTTAAAVTSRRREIAFGSICSASLLEYKAQPRLDLARGIGRGQLAEAPIGLRAVGREPGRGIERRKLCMVPRVVHFEAKFQAPLFRPDRPFLRDGNVPV